MNIFFDEGVKALYAHPLTLVDVGARGGLQPNWRAARAHLQLVGFEPDADEHARLAQRKTDGRTTYIQAAVAGATGEAVLNVGRDGGTSSLLEPNMTFLRRFPRAERFETVRQVAVKVDTLDRLLPAHGIDDPDFLKLDTQGAELAILSGAPETLDRIFGVEAEIQLGPLYVGQPSVGEIDEFLRSRGFQLFDLRPTYWKRQRGADYGGPKGQLVFADGLYLKTEEAFAEQLGRTASESRASKLARALSICALYGYLDYAMELLQAHRTVLGEHAALIERALTSSIPFSARLPHFRGRGWLSHAFYRMHRALFPTLDRWASGGRHLGNID